MDDFEQDTRAGRAYLGGYLETDKRGIPRHRYYPERSDDLNYCRAALARVLRSDRPVDRQMRDMLADLLEPEEPLEESLGFAKADCRISQPRKAARRSCEHSYGVVRLEASQRGGRGRRCYPRSRRHLRCDARTNV